MKTVLAALLLCVTCSGQSLHCYAGTAEIPCIPPSQEKTLTIGSSSPTQDGVIRLYPFSGSLQRAEQLTREEKDQLAKAQAEVENAVNVLDTTKSKIADAHKMKGEEYMEWKTWYEFDGDFILFRYRNNFNGLTISPASH